MLFHLVRQLRSRNSYSALDPVTIVKLARLLEAPLSFPRDGSSRPVEVLEGLRGFAVGSHGDTGVQRLIKGTVVPAIDRALTSTARKRRPLGGAKVARARA